MIPTKVLKDLSQIVGPGNFVTRREELVRYASDGTRLAFMPDAVAFPGNSEEISRIFILANQESFPVIPRGGGSGMSGGSLPVMGGLVLAMDRFNRILLIDRDNLIAKVEPSVITARLQEEVEKVGLFYPPDPASADVSTIGGNVAECAGGLRALKYGVTRDYVLGLTVVLPTGEIIRTGGDTIKGVAGYDLTRLIVGSEGTLAVITSITLRLIPKPAVKKSMLAFFPSMSSTAQTVSNIIREKIVPVTLEFMDRLCIDCIREELGTDIPKETGAMLLIEVDGNKLLADREAEKVRKICKRSGAIEFRIAQGRKEAEKLWEGKDSRKIVIDDLTGAFLTFFLIPGRLLTSRGINAGFLGLVVSGFLIFRLVDIIKPWPLRRLERLNGSAGVMLDDLAAGIAANVVLHILRYLLRG